MSSFLEISTHLDYIRVDGAYYYNRSLYGQQQSIESNLSGHNWIKLFWPKAKLWSRITESRAGGNLGDHLFPDTHFAYKEWTFNH